MPVVAAVVASNLDTVQDGLLLNGAAINQPITTTSRIMEVLRRHRTALLCRINNTRETHSTGMMDIMDSSKAVSRKGVSSFNSQRTHILASAVATKSMRHPRARRQRWEDMEMESSDDLEATESTKEPKDQFENCILTDVKVEGTDFPMASSI